MVRKHKQKHSRRNVRKVSVVQVVLSVVLVLAVVWIIMQWSSPAELSPGVGELKTYGPGDFFKNIFGKQKNHDPTKPTTPCFTFLDCDENNRELCVEDRCQVVSCRNIEDCPGGTVCYKKSVYEREGTCWLPKL